MIQLRPVRPDELPHVIDSWARSFHRFAIKDKTPIPITKDAWHRLHRAGIVSILESANAWVLVAVHSAEPDEILGWVCWEPPTSARRLELHYVFVKPGVRRSGIGRRLVLQALQRADERGIVATHKTWMWHLLRESLFHRDGGQRATA